MKRLVKRVTRVIWRSTAPVRRPFRRKLEAFLRHCLQPSEPTVVPDPARDEANVLMDHVVRELVRLQCQIEALEQTVLEHLPATAEPRA